MVITPAYNCLLGRPWIHAAVAVPSTLHQKLKFVIEGRLVSVGVEEDIIGMRSALQPIMKYDRSGMGYKHDPRQKMKHILKKREQRRAKLIGQSIEEEPMQFPHIFETFVSEGHIFSEKKKIEALIMSLERIQELSINLVGDEEEIERNRSKIRPCLLGCVLNN
ncbi:hypothetical protein V6N13_029254 [Hibiscus sabdariffa]